MNISITNNGPENNSQMFMFLSFILLDDIDSKTTTS